MSKHTPGPWSINEYGTIKTPDGNTLLVEGVALPSRSTAESIANTRLIAAAPELLQVVDLLIQYDEHDETEQSGAELWDEVMRLAHAAKAKAEGRS